MNATLFLRKDLVKMAARNVLRQVSVILSGTQKKMLMIVVLLSHIFFSASFSQEKTIFLSSYDSCHVLPLPQKTAGRMEALSVSIPMVRVAYIIPSNRTPQPDGVANLQNAIKVGQQYYKAQMEQNGYGEKTYLFETEPDGVTPLIHVVHVAETDDYFREDIWGRTNQAAGNAGISVWAPGEVWVLIPEAHLMQPDGTVTGGSALGASFGTGNSPGVAVIGSNALPLFNPSMITDDTPYDGKILPAIGPFPMKQSVTFAWFEGETFSSVASSWVGALLHEMGHAFGLAHDFRNDNNFHGNLMGNGLRGMRGSLFPEKYSQDYTRLEYASALILNVSHYFNRDKNLTSSPGLSYTNPGSVIPQQGLVHIAFKATDADLLSLAHLRYDGNTVAEITLEGYTADTAFAVPYFTQGATNAYTIAVHDEQGNTTFSNVEFVVPGGYNQAPVPFIRIDPPVPGLNQPITLNASQSSDTDHDPSSLLASWDFDNDGQFDTEPSTDKIAQHLYEYGGNYLIKLKLTDPAGAQTISTAVSIKIPGEKKVAVESFTLINADNDQAVADLKKGMEIKLAAWEGKTFSIRANTSPGMIDYVEFDINGPINHQQVDDQQPYGLFGDSPQGNFIGRKLLPGDYTLTATPFSSLGKGTALTVSFKVIEGIPDQPSILSDKTLGGTDADQLTSVVAAHGGGYLLAGHSSSNNSGDKSENAKGGYDYWIVRIDEQHNKLWDKTFGGERSEQLRSAIATPDGGYLLAGYSDSNTSGDKSENSKGYSDYWVVKIDAQGNKVWDKTFGGGGSDALYRAISLLDGGYLLAGSSDSHASGDKSENSKGSTDYWVLKIDNQGNKVWDKTFGGETIEELRSMIATNDGGFLLAGSSDSNPSEDKSENSRGSMDYWVLKIDQNGNKVWDKTIGGDVIDNLTVSILTPDGGYLLAGFSDSNASGDKSENGRGSWDTWVVKIDAAGNKVWDKTFGGNYVDEIGDAVSTPDGGYLLACSSDSFASGDKSENSKGSSDYWMIKIDNAGNKAWDKTIGGSGYDFLASASLTPFGSYLLAGYSNSNASGDKSLNSKGDVDFWIVELKEPTNPVTIDLTLMNAQTDQEIKELNDGDTIRLTETQTRLLDIRANITTAMVNKVTFDLKGPVRHQQTEGVAPYALFGDNQGDFNGKELLPGAYTLTVTSFINDVESASSTTTFTVTVGFAITGFTLIDATLDQPIRALAEGDVIDLSVLKNHKLAVRADSDPTYLDKVDFTLQGPFAYASTERVYPYVLFGDATRNGSTDYTGAIFFPGRYTLTATPYAGGLKGTPRTITFEVRDGLGISGFTLIDATVDKPIGPLSEGDVIDLSSLKDHKLAVRVDTQPTHIDKVDLTLQGPFVHSNTERVYPYALFGDVTQNGSTDYTGAKFFPGTYSLTATPYAGGVKGTPRTITFKVIRGGEAARLQAEVYPIPATGVINIRHEGQAEEAYMTLLDPNGKVLLHRPLSPQPVEQLDVSALRKGIHYLKVVSPKGLQIIRVVIE